MKLIERLIEEGGSDSGSPNFVAPKTSENVVRLIGRHFPSYVKSDSLEKKEQQNIAKMCAAQTGTFQGGGSDSKVHYPAILQFTT
ncbi:hypothetical protein TNCV_234411 [Trichonephila clavipes]|uniref:Uncharacterized protein n=1 Tax=Trichonephila clavipes TaxID=2585209 RepID=A0A8X6SK58_TRICX|nr:hypothetical protein TNCV_234411 [Trichonephila clavipes]